MLTGNVGASVPVALSGVPLLLNSLQLLDLANDETFAFNPAADEEKVSVGPVISDDGSDERILEILRLTDDVFLDDLIYLFPGFKGMGRVSSQELADILQNGLKLDKTRAESIDFAENLWGEGDVEEFFDVLQQDNSSLLTQLGANPFVHMGYPGISVLVGLKAGYEKQADASVKGVFRFTANIPADQLIIFAFLKHNGEEGWYEIELAPNGLLMATPLYQYVGMALKSAENAGWFAPEDEISLEDISEGEATENVRQELLIEPNNIWMILYRLVNPQYGELPN